MENKEIESSIKIEKKTFITAIAILGLLMVSVGILTLVIPTGSYERIEADGREMVVDGSFHYTDVERFPVWRWFTAPFEVLGSSDAAVVIVIIFFLLTISIAFALLENSDVMSLIISKLVKRFQSHKYLLMTIIVFFFMLLGAVLGTFEENIALVPILIALSYKLGWDSLTGLGMSLLASCFGFTAAITNPFSIAITQQIADLPLYSGTGLRIVIFIVFYIFTMVFLVRYAKKIEKNPEASLVYKEDEHLREKYAQGQGTDDFQEGRTKDEVNRIEKATKVFMGFIISIIVLIIAASLIPGLSDLELPIIGTLFLTGGVISSKIAGIKGKRRWAIIGKSAGGIIPGIVLILMAMSVKYIISQGGIMDTILYYASDAISSTSPYIAIMLIYALILLLELFVGSSSAKAFLVMPLIAPLSDLVGITRQTSVLAFCFGDGFSNVLYPTNPVLLICLGLTVVSYTKWIRWTYPIQLLAFIIACGFLFLGIATGYGPF